MVLASDFNDRRTAIIAAVADQESGPPEGDAGYDWALLLDGGHDVPSELVQIVRETYSDELERINWIRQTYPNATIAVEHLVFEAPAPYRGKHVHITGIVATFPTVAACTHYKLTFHV